MAIIKHRTSKNARHADVLDYYTYKHKEDPQTGHYEPILDENGLMIERDDHAVAYITAEGREAEPERWASACMQTNLRFRKNLGRNDRKTHEYIIAHPEEDHITVEQLLEEGKTFVRDNLYGYDCLLGAHDNHVHITINAVRALPRKQEEPWMMRDQLTGKVLPCEMEAGGKHQDSPGLRIHMNDWVLDYTQRHGFVGKDNNAIAAVHRAQRHGSKNEQMRTALLEAAGRSHNMEEFRQIMHTEYRMELKVSNTGNTISVLYPGNQKFVRLRTLELEPADLTRRFVGTEYVFTKEAEERQARKIVEEQERRTYAEWLQNVREQNNARTEFAAYRAEQILAEKLRGRGERYSKEEFGDIRYLIRQTAYASSGLQTELEKVDRLLGRWRQYHDESLSDQERRRHGGYVRWCGCDPDCAEELEVLEAEREVILAQKEYMDALHEALVAEADRWKGVNQISYAESDLAWTKRREKQLKQQLRDIRESRKKWSEIAYYCEKAYKEYDAEYRRRKYDRSMVAEVTAKWEKANRCRGRWWQTVLREEACREKLREIKQKKKEAKARLRNAKKQTR